ncbi:MAG: hypothetical protein ABTD50_09310 [Polyangiaceae bacterium]
MPFGLALLCLAATACKDDMDCDDVAYLRQPAVLELACTPTDLSSVQVSGPCATADGSTAPGDFVSGTQVTISSDVAGDCQVTLTFATGYEYSTTITFTEETDGCGTSHVEPQANQVVIWVENPASTCVDGGTDSGLGVD